MINAIASQQVSRTLGIRLLNRLAASYGAAVRAEGEAAYALPRSEELARLRPADLRRVGFSRQKGRAMVELAKSINEGGLDLEALAKLPDAEALEHLRGLPGVGSWTAEYVMLRGLGRTHIFPGDVQVPARIYSASCTRRIRSQRRQPTARWSAGTCMAGWFTFTCCWIGWRKQDSCRQKHRSHRPAAATTPMQDKTHRKSYR